MKKAKVEIVETEYKTPWALVIFVNGQAISDNRYKTKELAEKAIDKELKELLYLTYTSLEKLSETSNKVRLDMYQKSDVKNMVWVERK